MARGAELRTIPRIRPPARAVAYFPLPIRVNEPLVIHSSKPASAHAPTPGAEAAPKSTAPLPFASASDGLGWTAEGGFLARANRPNFLHGSKANAEHNSGKILVKR